mmetsp:Transcript_45902/g.109323  ORF Transcript_45902/g.109323 Transcript_45902/m.109323 type:complete len:341 (-) Transcript_45902:50-1072(-)
MALGKTPPNKGHCTARGGAESQCTVSALEDGEAIPWSPLKLPALPEPDPEQHEEARSGCLMVCGMVFVLVALTHAGVHLMIGSTPAWLQNSLLAAIHAEAVMGIICLAGVMCVDPGVVHRSERTCFPVPSPVLELLEHGEPLTSLSENVTVDNRTYCVRCLVWRDASECSEHHQAWSRVRCTKEWLDCQQSLCEDACGDSSGHGFHHCRTCQRCVRHFDHHCAFFGRCIAGQSLQGNLPFFRGICIAGGLGAATAMLSLVVGMTTCLAVADAGYYVAMAVLSYLAVVCAIGFAVSLLYWSWTIITRLRSWSSSGKGKRSRGGVQGVGAFVGPSAAMIEKP